MYRHHYVSVDAKGRYLQLSADALAGFTGDALTPDAINSALLASDVNRDAAKGSMSLAHIKNRDQVEGREGKGFWETPAAPAQDHGLTQQFKRLVEKALQRFMPAQPADSHLPPR